MLFEVNGTRTTVTITTVVEKFEECEVELGKAKVREYTDCPSSEDGDPTAWYAHAASALEYGAPHKIDCEDFGTREVISTETTVKQEWDRDIALDHIG